MNVICIPTHKKELDWYERVSLSQILKLYKGRNDIYLCVPQSNVEVINKKYGDSFYIQGFPDVYFSSERSYNELCLASQFYKCFKDYEYMLLYQLDAFVFDDDLESFCRLGFDYIGADTCDGYEWNRINESIGCGGLSLRKIDSHIRILEEHKELLSSHTLRDVFNAKEDVFWGFCGHTKDIDFVIPDIDTANRFAVTFGARKLVDPDNLPFGTHAWNRYDYGFWKPIIERLGYNLPSVNRVTYNKTDTIYEETVKLRDLFLKCQNTQFKPFKMCSIWGAGYKGIKCIRLLNSLGVRINHVFDWNSNALDGVVDITAPLISVPTYSNLQCISIEEILIVSTVYDQEIIGKIEGKNSISFDEFIRLLNNNGE